MPDTKISAMAAAAALDGTEQVAVVQSAANKRTTTGDIAKINLGAIRCYEEQPSGTAGGSSTANTWTKRVLNSTSSNSITGASLASNEIILPAGTYDVFASAPHYAATSFGSAIRLYNETDAAVILLGETQWMSGGGMERRVHLQGRFTLAASKNISIHSFVSVGTAASGLGVNAGLTGVANHFADIFIRRVA